MLEQREAENFVIVFLEISDFHIFFALKRQVRKIVKITSIRFMFLKGFFHFFKNVVYQRGQSPGKSKESSLMKFYFPNTFEIFLFVGRCKLLPVIFRYLWCSHNVFSIHVVGYSNPPLTCQFRVDTLSKSIVLRF